MGAENSSLPTEDVLSKRGEVINLLKELAGAGDPAAAQAVQDLGGAWFDQTISDGADLTVLAGRALLGLRRYL